MKVLIVDPDWFFLRQARDYLESRAHHVVSEPDPDRAIQRCQHWKPDLALVSAELPACCNGDLLERLGQVQPAPVVVLTAALERFDKAWQAWQRGGHDVLFKPMLHPSELHVAMVTAMESAISPRRRTLPGVQSLSA